MHHLRPWPVLLIAVLGVAAGPAPAERADLVIINAHVWTVDDTRPEAQAVAVRGERIALVGTSEEAQRLVGPGTRVVDAGGRLLLPGLQDGHTHFVSSGMEVGQLDLKDAASPEEFGRLIAEYAKRKRSGAWITGGNWDHEKWAGGTLPTAELIDRYVSDRPVFVTRYDGHMAVANSAALKAGNVTAQSEDPEGGSIVRRPGGREPAGVLKDAAMALVFKAIPEATPDELAEGARKAFAEARRLGLTTVQDMLEGEAHLRAYETVRAEGGMTARVYGRWPVAEWKWLADRVRTRGMGDDLFTLRSLKAFADGSIGSSTAFFYEPYTDDAKNFGLPSDVWTRLPEWSVAADAAGLQLSIHAIGDRAIHETLEIFDRMERTNGMRDRRPRVEHDQHTHPRDFRRHVELGAIASVQPYHAIDDGRFVEKRIGRRRSMTTYAFRTFRDHGVHMNFGSDWPVAPLDPILGIDAAVTRATLDGKNPEGWFPEQKVTVAEALRAYTLENAYAAFMEAKTGSITPGKYADLVLLGQDLFRIPPGRIKETRVDMTVMGGKVVYER
jgi:predicted amidohydrolase YtcJ